MRFGIIGDIHAEDVRLERVLEWMKDVDQILFVGDIVDGNGDLDRCIALLEEANALGVRGNHERWFFGNTMRSLSYTTVHLAAEASEHTMSFLRALPSTRIFRTPAGPLFLCHGMGEDDMGSLRPEDAGYALENNDNVWKLVRSKSCAIVVAGHTHKRMVRAIESVVFINAGALVQEEPCALVLDCRDRRAIFASALDTNEILEDKRF